MRFRFLVSFLLLFAVFAHAETGYIEIIANSDNSRNLRIDGDAAKELYNLLSALPEDGGNKGGDTLFKNGEDYTCLEYTDSKTSKRTHSCALRIKDPKAGVMK